MITCVTLNPCLVRFLFLEEEPAAGRTIRAQGAFWLAGGKGVNVARAVRALGGEALAVLGAGGATGEILRSCLEEEGVPVRIVPTGAPTRLGITFLHPELAEASWREVLEPGPSLTGAEGRELVAAAVTGSGPGEWLCLAGSSPSPAGDFLFAEMVHQARQAGSRVLLDTYGSPLREALGRGPELVKVNRAELESSLGFDPEAAYLDLRRAGGRCLVVTGGGGPVLVLHGRERLHLHPPAVSVRCPIGSGDCFSAGVLTALAEGWDLIPALGFGVAAGTANAVHLHTCAIDRQEVEGFLAQVEISDPNGGDRRRIG